MSQYFFPPEFAAELRERLDIVEIVGDYVSLVKSGANYKGLCPFHGEKTPSFMVHRGKGIYHCFGCGVGGDAISFLRRIENLTYPEALLRLALRAGIDVSPYERRRFPATGESAPKDEKKRLAGVVARAHEFYRQQLRRALKGRLGAYLAERGIPREEAERFQLGYAPPGWDNLLREVKKTADLDIAVQAGLIVKKENGKIFDRFRDRLLFPIRDGAGNVVGFGGRTLSGAEPKYLNSPESPLFYKRRLLYDLFYAKRAIGEQGQVFLVEGYMDALSLYIHGIDNVVATLGTALSREHLELVKRYASRVVVFFDNDAAGLQAAFRSLGVFLSAGIFPSLVRMPPGIKDPDQLVRELPPEEARQVLQKQVDLFDFYLGELEKKTQGQGYAARLQVLQEVVDLLVTLPERSLAGMALRSVAERLYLAEEVVLEVFRRQSRRRSGRQSPTPETGEEPTATAGQPQLVIDPEEMLLGILVRFPEQLDSFAGSEELFAREEHRVLLALLQDCRRRGVEPLAGLTADASQEDLLACYTRLEMLSLPEDKAIAAQALQDCWQRMKRLYWRRQEEELDREITACTDAEKMTALLRRKMAIKSEYC